MNIRLSLNLDKSLVDQAKSCAKENSVSLSKLIENYLNSLTSKKGIERKVKLLVSTVTFANTHYLLTR